MVIISVHHSLRGKDTTMDGAFHLFHSAQACVSERWKGVWLGDAGECRQGDGGLGSGGKGSGGE